MNYPLPPPTISCCTFIPHRLLLSPMLILSLSPIRASYPALSLDYPDGCELGLNKMSNVCACWDGWSPWSHIIGLSHNLGAAMLSTKGTHIFTMLPSAYGSNDSNKASRYLDVCGQLLETAMEKNPTAFPEFGGKDNDLRFIAQRCAHRS